MAAPDLSDESSLIGTRDGILNLAVALLEIVEACDNLRRNPPTQNDLTIDSIPEEGALWSNNLKKVLFQVPGHHPYIVGT
jgi:hypothetical protein